MKNVFLTISLIVSITTLYSQDSIAQNKDEYFIVLYSIGENWDTTKLTHEQLYFSEHSAQLSGLRKANKITIGARYSNKGMIILKANDQLEAQKIIAKDPAIQNKIFRAEIYSFYTFYSGCIE